MEDKQLFKMVAKTMAGLENVLAEELTALGAHNVEPLFRAVSFEGDKAIMYKANYCCRTALRILRPVKSFVARNELMLYNNIVKIPWHEFFDINETFAIDAVVSGNYFNHSQYVALKTKDAIADEFRVAPAPRCIREATARWSIRLLLTRCSPPALSNSRAGNTTLTLSTACAALPLSLSRPQWLL